MKIIDFITDTLVKIHSTYIGQVPQSELTPSVFGERAKEVMDFCKANSGILTFGVYVDRNDSYVAFIIADEDIKKKCNKH